jgi:hypothetical protein
MVFTILTMIFLLLIKLPLWELLLLIPLKIQPHPVLLLLFPFNLLLFSLILPLVAIPTFLLYSLHTMVEADPVAIPPLRCLRTIHLLDPGSPSPTCPIGPLRFALEPDPHHAPSTHLSAGAPAPTPMLQSTPTATQSRGLCIIIDRVTVLWHLGRKRETTTLPQTAPPTELAALTQIRSNRAIELAFAVPAGTRRRILFN